MWTWSRPLAHCSSHEYPWICGSAAVFKRACMKQQVRRASGCGPLHCSLIAALAQHIALPLE